MKLEELLENGTNASWIIYTLMGRNFEKMALVLSVGVKWKKFAKKITVAFAIGTYIRESFIADYVASPFVPADRMMLSDLVELPVITLKFWDGTREK